ncbi:MAG: polymer-forming cytoskeletal protein [Planctomycetes bacterium]|nr:polymer-forming cytoskeletal protein [Planctomycetota bacterium]
MNLFPVSKKSAADPAVPIAPPPDELRLRPDGAAPGERLRASRDRAATTSTLNPHLSFEGELKYTGKVSVDCEFRGSIVTSDTLLVGPSAVVHANLTVGVIEISGKIHGDVKATKSVRILSGGEVHGNIETPTISMEEGVVFEGSCSRPPDAPAPAPEKVTRSAARATPPIYPAASTAPAPAPRTAP